MRAAVSTVFSKKNLIDIEEKDLITIGFFAMPKAYNGRGLTLKLYDAMANFLLERDKHWKAVKTFVTNPYLLKSFFKARYELKGEVYFEDLEFEGEKPFSGYKEHLKAFIDEKPAFYQVIRYLNTKKNN